MGAKGIDMEALSPRDANAQRAPRLELKTKAVAQLKSSKDKEHPPPPPNNVIEPPSADRKEGAVYQVGKMLGKGGFAICYDGKLAGSSKRYALKIVKSKMPSKMEQKFQTELQIHSKMQQVNIVQFHRAFTFESCTYLVLELCPNGSLMDMVKRRKGLTEPEVRFYTVQIAGAIKYMHAKGIIHRDLKMGNIFLDRHMNAKIGDFGLAALLLTGKDMQIMRRTTLCGTPNYIAPEILEKGKKGHDHMVDIWSLGVIVFAMLTSKPPFQSSTTDEIYRRARELDYDWPSSETSQKFISAEAKDLVATMLQDATMRPDPDTIVEHEFFTSGYMPTAADITSKLREIPPESAAFYQEQSAHVKRRSEETLQAMCNGCGVGPWMTSKMVFKNIWREMADEEQHGLTPMIPLAEGIVYRPFDEIRSEQRLQERLLRQSQMQQSMQAASKLEDPNSSAFSISSAKPPTGLLRAPPQSFAAQQRAQGRPVASGIVRSQTSTEMVGKPTGTLRSRARREPKSTEEAPAPSTSSQRAQRHQLLPSKAQPVMRQTEEVKPDLELISLFGPAEKLEQVPDTQPDLVLGRLRMLQSELERALNSRSMAILSAKDKTPSPPCIVVKWVDYTNKFGLGYILNDGTVGCILKGNSSANGEKEGWLPPSSLVVRGAEQHCLRRDDRTYLDRHQVVPMNEPVYFYENCGEKGFSRLGMNPKLFSTKLQPDGTVAKLTAGKDVWEHRKRERIVLWKKFANYMIAYGRESEGLGAVADVPTRASLAKDSNALPGDVVTFYQRFGDVGCWMFCDGHVQFNFPDHTKIVLDATGTWCHFWHLPLDAAKRLEETGSLSEAALDDRTVLSYPLQTLLNFSAPVKQPAMRAGSRSASNPTRFRPEIRPELQGVPAANYFRKKVEFIRDIVKEWNGNNGLGNSDMSRENRLRWTGLRETKNAVPTKHVWTTIGARRGDERCTAIVDPRTPAILGDEVDDTRKRSAA